MPTEHFNRILASVSVKGVIVGSQLWHLPWRPVHRHRIWRQESYSLRGDLLNSDWLKKRMAREWGEGFPCTSDCTERQGVEPETLLLLCSFVCVWEKWETGRSSGARSGISGKVQTVLMLCWLVCSCAVVDSSKEPFCFLFLNKIKPP